MRRHPRQGPAVTVAVLFATLGTAPRAARAETPADIAVARDLFREGSRHAQRGAWDEARENFERSLALRHAPLTLYSLGVAQKNLGLLVEATESFYAFLAEPSVPATRPYEAPARAAIAELEGRLAHITLTVTPPDVEGLRVRIDNEEVARAALGVPRPINPGDHFLAVSANGHRPVSQRVHLSDRETQKLVVTLEPFALAPRPEPAAPTLAPRPLPPIVASPPPLSEPPSAVGPWLLVAAGALAAAGGLWVSTDAIASDTPGGDDRSARRRALAGQTMTFGGLVALGTGVGILLSRPSTPASPAAGSRPRRAPSVPPVAPKR
jgi:hypothetical protein